MSKTVVSWCHSVPGFGPPCDPCIFYFNLPSNLLVIGNTSGPIGGSGTTYANAPGTGLVVSARVDLAGTTIGYIHGAVSIDTPTIPPNQTAPFSWVGSLATSCTTGYIDSVPITFDSNYSAHAAYEAPLGIISISETIPGIGSLYTPTYLGITNYQGGPSVTVSNVSYSGAGSGHIGATTFTVYGLSTAAAILKAFDF